VLVWAAVAAAATGLAAMVAATGGAGLPVALGWAIACAVLAGAEAIARSKRARVFIALVTMLALVVLTFEGGLFLIPAAALLMAAMAALPEPPAAARV
jgi:hypothetical protein